MTRRGLPAVLVLLATACGPHGPIARRTGPGETRGNLTTWPIEFATTDYYFAPTRVDAEEGRLMVPESRSRPNGRQMAIRYVRFPSTSRTPGDPVVYLAGGPGGSAILTASEDRFRVFMRLRGVGDVIALDQRGVRIEPPRFACPGAWSYPLDRPYEAATLSAMLTPYLVSCVRAWAESLDVAAFNTVEKAEDLDDLRRALGADRLNLVGISYGTHLALAYLRRHPDRVRRASLHGVEGPDDTWKLPAAIDAVLRRVDSAMARDARLRRVMPSFEHALRRAIERLGRSPVTAEVEEPRTHERLRVTVGPDDLRRAIFFAIRRREEIAEIPARVLPMLRSDYAPLALWAARTRRDNRELVMPLSMDCASGVSRERLERIDREAPGAVLGDIANLELRVVCAAWPRMDLGEDYRSPVRADVPVLFVSGTLDARTPVEQADRLLRGFPNGRHLVIEGASHDDDLFLSSPRISQTLVEFLEGREPSITRIVLPPLRFNQR